MFNYWQARGQVPVQSPSPKSQKVKHKKRKGNLASRLLLNSYGPQPHPTLVQVEHYQRKKRVWSTGPVGNLESYPVHNQIHGLVPINYESSFTQYQWVSHDFEIFINDIQQMFHSMHQMHHLYFQLIKWIILICK